MAFFKKKKKAPTMTREQALSCIPVQNNVVSWNLDESGLVNIEYVLVLKPLFYSIFKRFAPSAAPEPTRKLQLDERGSSVWRMIDGTNSTADLIKLFSAKHQISTQDAEQSITLFLRELGKRGLIGLK